MPAWKLSFLGGSPSAGPPSTTEKRALIILNQPFSRSLFTRLWSSCQWRCCADGGANHLYDLFASKDIVAADRLRSLHLPDLIKGDLDSIRPDVRQYYASHNVTIIEDHDQYSTDLMKCISSLTQKENAEGHSQFEVVLLGGLSGRLDQTVHTLSYLHKLRKVRKRVFVVTDESVGWVLAEGEHYIHIDHTVVGPTCGLLPVGVDSTVLSTKGLRWNLTEQQSSFDGLMSTSNHLVPGDEMVWIKTSRPIWWCIEMRRIEKAVNVIVMVDHPKITVLYFAAASTATGLVSERVSLPDAEGGLCLSALGALLVSLHPTTNLEEILESSQWSVGAEMVDEPERVILRGGEEVAIISPVSGG